MNAAFTFPRPSELLSEVNPLSPGIAAKTKLLPHDKAVSTSLHAGNAHTRLLDALIELQTELFDSAFDLEQRSRFDAAELACTLARRLEILVAESSPS